MATATFRVVTSPPSRLVQPGRGFYQLEEDALYVPIGAYSAERRFFSSIESDDVRLDMDKSGELLFIEVSLPRKKWKVDNSLAVPNNAALSEIRWLDFRADFESPTVLTNPARDVACIQLLETPAANTIQLAEEVILQTTSKDHACRIWISRIVDDTGGREIAAFRKQHHA